MALNFEFCVEKLPFSVMLKRKNILLTLLLFGFFQISCANNPSANFLYNSNNGTNATVHLTSNELTSWDSILRLQNPKDVVFKVVIGTFVEPLDIECSFLRKVRDDLTVENTDEGQVRYAIGAFDQYQKALTHCNTLISQGYKHAKVLAYNQEDALAMPIENVLEWLAQQ